METTKQHLEAIHRFLDRMSTRQRRLLLGEGLAWVLSGAMLVSIVAGSLVSAGFHAKAVSQAVMLVGLLAVVGVVRAVRKGRWSQASVRVVQARRVEQVFPGLRGRLITVVELSEERPGVSEFLFARAAQHASRAVAILQPSLVHGAQRCKGAWGMTAVVVMLTLGLGSAMPVGPIDVWRVLSGHSAASIRLAESDLSAEEDATLVGDITLRYVFPEYTGMAPREVPNSDGTIIAPPGTQVVVTARSADAFEAAALQLDDGPAIDATLSNGRDIRGRIDVEQSGSWRVLLFKDGEVQQSPAYEVRVESDMPPVVVTSETGESMVAVDAPLGLGWQATDDYGMVRVSVEIVKDGQATEVVVREPVEVPTELNGIIRASPRKLGLRAGDEVELRVVALDNDRLEGGKEGASETLFLKVLGPRGYGKNLTRYHEKLRDALIDGLADFLEDPVPPAETRQGLIRWLYEARKRLDPVRAVIEEQWGDEISSGIDGELVQDVMEASGRLFRFTLMTFDRDAQAGGQQPTNEDLDTFFDLHGTTIKQLEIAAFVIDSMLRQVGVGELARQAGIVAKESRSMTDSAKDSDDVDAMTAKLDRLERQLGKLRRAASKLEDDSLAEFVEGVVDQSQAMTEYIRSAISDAKLDEARAMMELMTNELEHLQESLTDRELRQQEAAQEMNERFQQLLEDLESLAKEQDGIASKLSVDQDDEGAEFSDLVSIWERFDALAKRFVQQMDATIAGVGDGREWPSYAVKRIEDLVHLGRGIQDSVRGRDVQGVALRVTEAGVALPITKRFVERVAKTNDVAKKVEASLVMAAQTHVLMTEMLREIAARPEESRAELIAISGEISKEQARLQDKQRALQEEVREIEGSMPTSTGAAIASMKQAGQAMESARTALDAGMPMQGEGHQRHASDLVRETKEHLEQASSKQQQMQQMMQQMQGKQSADGSRASNQMVDADIPAPELFKTPERYREALLEGMTGAVPEEFKALKRRFYEDLVRQ